MMEEGIIRPKKHKRDGHRVSDSGSRPYVEREEPIRGQVSKGRKQVQASGEVSDGDDSTIEKSQLFAKLNEMQIAIAGYKESKERPKSPPVQ